MEDVEIHADGYNHLVRTNAQSTRLDTEYTLTQNVDTKNRHNKTIFQIAITKTTINFYKLPMPFL